MPGLDPLQWRCSLERWRRTCRIGIFPLLAVCKWRLKDWLAADRRPPPSATSRGGPAPRALGRTSPSALVGTDYTSREQMVCSSSHMHGVALSTSISGGAKDPADECSSEAAFPALPCTPPFLLRTPRRADALLIRCILTSQVLHLQATLSSGRVLLGTGVGKEDSIFSCKIRCAAALSASNPVPLPRAPACSLHAFLKLLSPDCLG